MDFNIDADGAAAAPRRIVLLGNPNVGKSALFNALTGLRATVSNYPGTTVEVYRGRLAGGTAEVIDSPGLNSLMPLSEDERVTSELVRSVRGEPGSVVVQVADAKNLRRALLLTLQLGQLEMPTVLVLNMHDEAQARGIRLDLAGHRGGARRPGARDRGDARAGCRRREASARRGACPEEPPADSRGRGGAGASPALGPRRAAAAASRVPLALPRGAARPRRHDRAALRERRQHGGQGVLAPARPAGGTPGVGLADPRGCPLRALRVRGRLRRGDARRPARGRLVPRLPEPLGGHAVLVRADRPGARPVRRGVRPRHDGPVVLPRDRAADHRDLLHRLRASRGLGLPAAARGDDRPRRSG